MKATIFCRGIIFASLISGHCLAVPAEIMPTQVTPEEPLISRMVFTNASLGEVTEFLSRKRCSLAPQSAPIRLILDLPPEMINARQVNITFQGVTLDQALTALAAAIDIRVVAVSTERQLKLKESAPK